MSINGEIKNIYPQILLDQEEYLIFVNKCEYLNNNLKLEYIKTDIHDLSIIILNDCRISQILRPNQIKVIEKFYYYVNLKYLEQKIKELTEIVLTNNKILEAKIRNIASSK